MKLTWGKLMRMYKVYHTDPDEGTVLDWFSRSDDAEAFHANMMFGDFKPSGIEIMEIPISRLGMCSWLNAHFKRDSG